MFAASKTDSVSGGYQISRSLRFNSADSAYLNRTLTTPTNNTTWSWSGWVKLGQLGTTRQLFGGAGANYGSFGFESTDQFRFWNNAGAAAATSTAVYRDPSAWYHIVVISNGTTIKAYVNNSEVLSYTGTITNINSAITHQIGRFGALSYYYDGYMTEVNFIDGQALTPSSFGETNSDTGVWQPKAYSGSYGTNGFYLNFSDNSNTTAATLGKDYSGNGNNFTPNNFSVTAGAGNDSLVDSPTSYGTDTGVGGEVRGNYSTLNPLNISGTLANGNLDYTGPTGTAIAPATIGMSSGKWYFEMTATSTGVGCGVSLNSASLTQYLGQNTSGWGYFTDGLKYTNNSGSSYGATFTTGDVIGVAFDADAGTLVFYKNGTSQGTAFSSLTSGPYFFTVSDGSSPEQRTCSANFGQRPFAYTAPSGYKALCTQNFPTPTIGATTATQAGKYFAPVIYSGDGTTGRSIAVGFQPDFTWIKTRSPADWHVLDDSVRGAGKILASNSTQAEATDTTAFNAFNSNGFVVGTSASWHTNRTGGTYVAWSWKGNGSGSTNTSGSITSTVSANTTSGFSVVTYTGNGTSGATVGHGLGVAPKMIIVKNRSTGGYNWPVYHSSLSANNILLLNTTDAQFAFSAFTSTPSSSVFTVGSWGGLNASPDTYVAYCFAEVAGYSKFGSYTGNGSADGPFVYCGFRPAFVMTKSSSNASNWIMLDNKRNTYNVEDKYLTAETADAEGTFTLLDFTSNGFKIRTSDTSINGGDPRYYIFMAFAENPFKTSLAR